MPARRVALPAALLVGALSASGCKKSPLPPTADAAVDVPLVSPPSGSTTAATPKAPPPAGDAGGSLGWRDSVNVDTLAVSSRVDNATEKPLALVDQDLDTAWSSRTGDLVGAWVALRIVTKTSLRGVHLTVGMTKDAALFAQNPRVSAVSVRFTPTADFGRKTAGPETTLASHVALDPTSRALQRVPFEIEGEGILKLTVDAVTPGSNAAWREITISEVALEGRRGLLAAKPTRGLVGGFEPKPRGVLGLTPEDAAPLRCLATAGTRAICALGTWGIGANPLREAELVALSATDPTDKKWFANLEPNAMMMPEIPYGAWLEAEKSARAGRSLAATDKPDAGTSASDAKIVPWEGSLAIGGTTFRVRQTEKTPTETSVGSWTTYNGVVEVRWPGDTAFGSVFAETATPATSPMTVSVRPLGSAWLVERLMSHGSEGMSVFGAEAAICEPAKKSCR